jgi:hypothetical protein
MRTIEEIRREMAGLDGPPGYGAYHPDCGPPHPDITVCPTCGGSGDHSCGLTHEPGCQWQALAAELAAVREAAAVEAQRGAFI